MPNGWRPASTSSRRTSRPAPADWRATQAIRAARASSGARFRYEATVGAGLPVISTLRDLLDTGDELLAVEGILSGTLAWLFNRSTAVQPFSELVREAHALGYTEPDARDDLSGTDVARKLVILAREAGMRTERSTRSRWNPGARPVAGVGGRASWRAWANSTRLMQERWTRAPPPKAMCCAMSRAWTRTATRRPGRTAVATHAFAHLQLTDNIVQFTTRRYCDNPLVVQGPGAGPEVTAAGVFADLLRVAAALGARL
jgi:aspartokinase/homoserine dehydrogenase 1